MFLPGDKNTSTIRKLISESKKLDLAVAFLGQEAEQMLLIKGVSGKIICNLSSGGTNPKVVENLIENSDFEIRNNSLLHAKVYIGETETVISSANLSANGLGLEGKELAGWHEAGFRVSNPTELKRISEWFSELWESSSEITDSDIQHALDIWKKRRNNRPVIDASNSLFDELKAKPESLLDKNIYLVICNSTMSTGAKQKIKTINIEKKENKLNIDAYYEDWSELPEDSYFIDVFIGHKNTAYYNGLYKSPSEKFIIMPNESNDSSGELFRCHEKKDIYGFLMDKKDIKLLRNKASELLESAIGEGDSGGKYIPILDARAILFSEAGG